jgi:hypothetical protein
MATNTATIANVAPATGTLSNSLAMCIAIGRGVQVISPANKEFAGIVLPTIILSPPTRRKQPGWKVQNVSIPSPRAAKESPSWPRNGFAAFDVTRLFHDDYRAPQYSS